MTSDNVSKFRPEIVEKLEKKSRNPILSKVQEMTEKTYQLLLETHICTYELNPGNHFSDVDERIIKGITWMNKVGVNQYE